MALDPVKNFAISRVATAPSPADSGTTLVVETGDGALFPDPSSSGEYNVVIYPNGEQPTSTNAEIVRVTARTSDTMTIDREEEGTSARTIVEGDIVMLAITAKMVSDLSTAVTGVVTEDAEQTLTNKTLTAPALSSPTISGAWDGWISAGETWTYASATTITVPSGAASKYQKGDKIKITNNSATKYFYIVGVADTVLTVTGGTDYTVHDSAITNPFFSKIENPQGFPQYFAWTPTVSGTSSMTYTSVTITGARFCLKGKTCFWCFVSNGTIGGTTNAYMTHTVPITGSSSDTNYMLIGNGDMYGDGSAINQLVCSVWNSSSRSNTLVYKHTTSAFTAGAGRSLTLKGTYEIA